MKHIHRTDDEWMGLITRCRQSGLGDDRWCREHGIPVSTFYRHVKILRQKACDVPAPIRENIPGWIQSSLPAGAGWRRR